MITLTNELRLDINQNAPVATDIVLTQNDTKTYIFNVRIYDGSQEIDYDVVDHAWIVFAKADKSVVQGVLSRSDDGGYTYTLGTNEIAAVGKTLCSVILYGADGERISTSRFEIRVQADLLGDDAIESTTEYTALIHLIQRIEDMIDSGELNGKGFVVLGYYETFEDMTNAQPSPLAGDAYGIGTEPPYRIWVWDGVNHAWVDNGDMEGPPGEDGEPGPAGVDGTTPHIAPETKHWMIGTTDTGVVAEGMDGAPGAKWYTAEIAPTGASEGDYWLSTSPATLGNVYRFDGADWELQVNIKGQDGTGSGDMLWAAWRAIYDPTASGKVQAASSADAVPWDGIGDKPSTFAPSAHSHGWGDVNNVPAASTAQPGIVQLSNAIDSTAEDMAATPKAVKSAYEEAVNKGYPEITHASGTQTISPNTVNLFGDSIATIALTLGTALTNRSNEYVIIVDSTASAPSFTITSPSGVKWGDANAPSFETGKIYLIVVTKVMNDYWGFWEAR